MLEWTITEYNSWVNNSQPIDYRVQKLNLNQSNLSSLYNLDRLPNLRILIIANNIFHDLHCVKNLTSLVELNFIVKKPSEYDLASANEPSLLWLIVSLSEQSINQLSVWRLSPDKKNFSIIPLSIIN